VARLDTTVPARGETGPGQWLSRGAMLNDSGVGRVDRRAGASLWAALGGEVHVNGHRRCPWARAQSVIRAASAAPLTTQP
jgi:hypothetical protein